MPIPSDSRGFSFPYFAPDRIEELATGLNQVGDKLAIAAADGTDSFNISFDNVKFSTHTGVFLFSPETKEFYLDATADFEIMSK